MNSQNSLVQQKISFISHISLYEASYERHVHVFSILLIHEKNKKNSFGHHPVSIIKLYLTLKLHNFFWYYSLILQPIKGDEYFETLMYSSTYVDESNIFN